MNECFLSYSCVFFHVSLVLRDQISIRDNLLLPAAKTSSLPESRMSGMHFNALVIFHFLQSLDVTYGESPTICTFQLSHGHLIQPPGFSFNLCK